MKSAKADVAEFLALCLEDAKDDVSVTQAVAISRQYLSPAPSPNPERQVRFTELAQRIDLDDHAKIEQLFDDALDAVTHFASGAPFVRMPRFVLHVGPGLAQYSKPGDYVGDFVETLKTLRVMTKELAYVTSTQESMYQAGSIRLIAPEAMRNEAKAALDVMASFAEVRQTPRAVLVVVCLSEGIVSALLGALVDTNLHSELAVCLHSEAGNVSVHRMDIDGCLEDWPYGVLSSHVSSIALEELGFNADNN